MSIVHDHGRLVEAARALVKIDQAGYLSELGDEISCARREHRQREQNKTTGEKIYVDSIAAALSKITGADLQQCREAAWQATRPNWTDVALDEILAFAKTLPASARRAG